MVNTGPLVANGIKHYADILTSSESSTAERRQANLVLNDPYYSTLYERLYSSVGHREAIRVLDSAGCFDDTLEERIQPDTHYLSASYPAMKKNLSENLPAGKKPAIVLSTGSFDPLHSGHVETLVRAKEYVDANSDYHVVGGVLSGGHDHYVRMKNIGGLDGFGRVAKNLDFLDRHVANHSEYNNGKPWIFHDSMECVGADVAWNFTDVIVYVQAMLEEYVANGIKIFFVFGSDNAGFSWAFTHEDKSLAESVCVYRPGYELEEKLAQTLNESTTAHFTLGYSSESSTNVRKLLVPKEEEPRHRVMALRQDWDQSMNWSKDFFVNNEEWAKRKESFLEVLVGELGKSFNEVVAIDVPKQIEATKTHLEEHFPNQPVLSCDVYFEGDKTIRCSRLFDVSSTQRHGNKTTYEEIEVADTTEYVFVDDDIFSGRFLDEMRNHFNITDSVSMADVALNGSVYDDIVDVRDFIIGGIHGGLMVQLDQPKRVPYLHPFLNLDTRASIFLENLSSFNKNLWKANFEFYKDTDIRIGQLPNNQGDFLTYVGFDVSDTVESAMLYFWRKM